MNRANIHAAVLWVVLASPVMADAHADGWITHADAGTRAPIVLQFRRELQLDRVPARLPVSVTADNRFILHVNGTRIASGPSTGTVKSWRYATVDLAPYLVRGANEIAATVWNFGDVAPAMQQIVATGFRLIGEPVSTSAPGWQVRIDEGHSAVNGKEHISWQYYVASAPEVVDARRASSQWQSAIPAPAAAARTLIADPLPQQLFVSATPGQVVRSSIAGGENFPGQPLVIPANTAAKLLIRRDAMISAYPALDVQGGKDATIKLQYGEALYDKDGRKGDRNLVGDRQMRGFHDTFIADGQSRELAPLWWRTFRFVEIEVVTKSEPLTLRALRLNETGYPFEQVASFVSSDAELNRIWDIGWRTMRVDSHETFMDSSYWEQLQYTGDTRIEMLVTYAVSGDARLARQAIEAFAESDVDGGLMQGAYPSRLSNVIATFAFAWVGMLADWSVEQPDNAIIVRHLPRMRRVLAWFEPLLNKQGLLGKNPQWNFIDWSGQKWDDRDTFPSWGSQNGSCLMTAMWLGALRQGDALERTHGDASRATEYRAKAGRARQSIREHCWVADKGLFADDGDRKVFSQHMNVFAVLYDVATREEAPAILERIIVRGRGIDAPAGMYSPTYYFAWYLVRAYEHAGLADRYFSLLQTWRELLALNYTTWPESRDQPRSDTHAWSAHPTADLLRVVAGIRPAAPGYARLQVAPVLGHLTTLDATAMTPHGPVKVSYRIAGNELSAVIDRPATLPGTFVWRGKSHPLTRTRTQLELPL
ncbi:MAG TPA: family 78 glycoside hydrolase catalytic domain [Steroidobacteraceae bacterium]|nr:family 78 glycoside hydrolase catalytic domain [Steroidobacteraceae bacterium]